EGMNTRRRGRPQHLSYSNKCSSVTPPGEGGCMDVEAFAQAIPRATRSDRDAARAVAMSVNSARLCELGEYHGVEVVDLCNDVLNLSPKMQECRRGQALMQRVCGAVLTYRNQFVPNPSWRFVGGSSAAGVIVWRRLAEPGTYV